VKKRKKEKEKKAEERRGEGKTYNNAN